MAGRVPLPPAPAPRPRAAGQPQSSGEVTRGGEEPLGLELAPQVTPSVGPKFLTCKLRMGCRRGNSLLPNTFEPE